jgi:hypothetical protein
MWKMRCFGFLVGLVLLLDGLAGAQTAPNVDVKRPCQFAVQSTGGKTELRGWCANYYGGPWEIEAVVCDANTPNVTVLPRLTNGGPSSIIPTPLTCGTNAPAGVEVQGTPRLNVRGADGASCAKPPCDLEITIVAPADGQPHTALITIVATLTVGPKP